MPSNQQLIFIIIVIRLILYAASNFITSKLRKELKAKPQCVIILVFATGNKEAEKCFSKTMQFATFKRQSRTKNQYYSP